MSPITPDEARQIELAQTIFAVVSAGACGALAALPFFYGGRLLLTIIGG